MAGLKLRKRPTRAQQLLLVQMVGGATVLLSSPGLKVKYTLVRGRDAVRTVSTRMLAEMQFNGWVWSGVGRPSLVITEAGRHAIS